MSILKNVIIKETATPLEIEYPGIEGFVVQLTLLPKDSLMKLREKCTKKQYNKATRQYEDSVDLDQFVEMWTKKVLRGWKGLKMKHLPRLLAVDISGQDPEMEIVFDEDTGMDLMRNSTVFENWINDQINDFEQFSVGARAETVKN